MVRTAGENSQRRPATMTDTVGTDEETGKSPCECIAAGWCERHRCRKTTELWQHCRTDPALFDLWERGEGPGQLLLPKDPSQEPGLWRKAWNLSRAVVRHVAHGTREVSDAVYRERLLVCESCSSCDTSRMVCREQSCGCYVQIKARWESESCPLKKWPLAHA